jgi:two-component system nitrate/nitrite response regulator NarL
MFTKTSIASAPVGKSAKSDPEPYFHRRQDSPIPRERQVMLLAARGFSNKEIARELNISEGTVKVHLHNVYDSLGISKRSALPATLFRRQAD